MTPSEKEKYLARLNLADCRANLASLTKLQDHHMEQIPFENLDIVVGRKIDLAYEQLFEKIVERQRGGYCFELNLLYSELLRTIGFLPKPVLGRVWLSNPKNTPPRNHLAHLVELDGKTYVTDVGFAGLITRVPLDIHNSDAINDKDGMVRVIPYAGDQFMIQRETEKGWTNLYSLETIEISRADIEIANHYMSTHPDSHFYEHRFVGKNTTDGRIGLFNNKMSIRKGIKVVDKKRVDFGEGWLEVIKNQFSVELDFSEEELKVLFQKK